MHIAQKKCAGLNLPSSLTSQLSRNKVDPSLCIDESKISKPLCSLEIKDQETCTFLRRMCQSDDCCLIRISSY